MSFRVCLLLFSPLLGRPAFAGQDAAAELARDIEGLSKAILTEKGERIPDGELQARAERLARKHGAERATLIAQQVATPVSIDLIEVAALLLANLGSEPAAETVLLQLAIEAREDARGAVVSALAYLDTALSRKLLKKMVVEPRDDGPQLASLELLCIVGNRESRDHLGAIQAGNKVKAVQAALNSWLPVLDHKLALTDPQQAKTWESQALAYWRGCAQASQMNDHSAAAALDRAASRIAAQVPEISTKFLQLRVKAEDPVAPLLLAHLKKEGEVLKLSAQLPKRTHWGRAVRNAMRQLGTEKAVREMESAIPVAEDPRIRRELAMSLSSLGDQKTADLLQKLLDDPQSDQATRETFAASRDAILQRLKKKGP